MKFDFHCHSTASDGKLSPEALAEQVKTLDLDVIALTDHDCIDGFLQLKSQGLLGASTHWLSGVEFSSLALNQNIHVVGLDFDETHPVMTAALEVQAQKRQERAVIINERLMKKQLPNCYERALSYAQSETHIGRPHFAQALVDLGVCKSRQVAFDKYLGAGKTGDVKASWPQLEDVVGWINDSGGVAVLAHPLRYKMTFTKLKRLITLFAEAGGEAVEVVGQQAEPNQLKRLHELVLELGLAGSGGSDFHDPDWRWAQLGDVKPIPESITPVWECFKRSKIKP